MAAKKHHTPEQIIHLLRQAEFELAGGQAVPQMCRKLAVSEQTYYRWRKEYRLGGIDVLPFNVAGYVVAIRGPMIV